MTLVLLAGAVGHLGIVTIIAGSIISIYLEGRGCQMSCHVQNCFTKPLSQIPQDWRMSCCISVITLCMPRISLHSIYKHKIFLHRLNAQLSCKSGELFVFYCLDLQRDVHIVLENHLTGCRVDHWVCPSHLFALTLWRS